MQLVVTHGAAVAGEGGGNHAVKTLAQWVSVLLVHGDRAEDEGVAAAVRAGLVDEQQIHGHPSTKRKSRVSQQCGHRVGSPTG